jgi:signal transduction histidine kinase
MTMTTSARHPISREYWKLQFIFWSAYWLLNLIFAGSWGYNSWLTNVLFVFLSVLLVGVTHGYRLLYVRYALDKPIGTIGLHLLWLLPLSALLIQILVSAFVYICLQLFPVAPQSVGPWSAAAFVTYVFNTAIILMLWCLVCLWRFESLRRRETERDHWRNEVRLREVELQFLRSQINSHFLFNALNNIRALILEDPQAARQGLSDLATLLRGVMHSEAVSTVSLRDEVELVKGYLALEALQFEQRLSFDLAIDPRVQDARLPPLLLQTLVENAIKHGIARRATGGAVRISAVPLAGGRWRLEVENPPAELPPKHASNGIGLKNARERLKAVFGELASLDLAFAGNVRATAELPL